MNNDNNLQVLLNKTRKIIDSDCSFELPIITEGSSEDVLLLTAAKIRIITEGICRYIILSADMTPGKKATFHEYIGIINTLIERTPELKVMSTYLTTIQNNTNYALHYQIVGNIRLENIRQCISSLHEIAKWFVSNYEYSLVKHDNLDKSRKKANNKYDLSQESNPYYSVNKDFNETLLLANKGSVKAMFEVANMYFYGISGDGGKTERNCPQAFYWFKRLSETDERMKDYSDYYKAYGIRYLGHMYYAGMVPSEPQSYKKCFDYFPEAACLNGEAVSNLAYMYSIGSGCEMSLKNAEELYLKVAEDGDPGVINDLAKLYCNKANYKKAQELYVSICNKVPSAAYELGLLYKKGLITKRKKPDYFKAHYYFEMSINAGFCEAESYLEIGKMHFNPTGDYPLNFKEAEKNFLQAYKYGNYEACYILGYMYQNGHLDKQPAREKAVFYHTKAALHGISASAVSLAILFQEQEDYDESYRYSKMAYNMGNAEGAFLYGNCLFIGRGCGINIYEAKKAYTYACEHGCRQAEFMRERLEGCLNQMNAEFQESLSNKRNSPEKIV